jgi:hypothetical protein
MTDDPKGPRPDREEREPDETSAHDDRPLEEFTSEPIESDESDDPSDSG